MQTLNDVFEATMSLIDELRRSDGSAHTSDTEEYEQRTPRIMKTLVSEYNIMVGKRGIVQDFESMDDDLIGIDDSYAVGVMQYGLAAKLLLDENPAAASFYHQKYEEMREIFFARAPAPEDEEITDLYGGIELGQFGHW